MLSTKLKNEAATILKEMKKTDCQDLIENYLVLK